MLGLLALDAGPLRGESNVDFRNLAGEIFPDADRVGSNVGSPPSAPVYAGGSLLGYAFSTHDVVRSVGYSGQPLDVVAGIDLAGRVTGARLFRHNEPILVIGVPEERLHAFVRGLAGIDIARPAAVDAAPDEKGAPDIIAGATVSSGVIRDAVIRAARAVARSRGLLGGDASQPRLDRDSFETASWQDLLDDGSLRRLVLTRGIVAESLARLTGDPGGTLPSDPDRLFIELFVGLATPARVGQNLLGPRRYGALSADLGTEEQIVFVAANGAWSFKGTRYRRSGTFDRLQLVQDERTIRLTRDGYANVERLKIDGAPELREMALFRIADATGFDPLAPWRVELLVPRDVAGGGQVLLTFALDYRLPDRYLLAAPAGDATDRPATSAPTSGDEPLWLQTWRSRLPSIGMLIAMLLVLSAILVFQDALVRHPRVYRQVRLWYLGVTLVWLGFIAGAQLSVFNVLTFAHALLTEFRWEFFLLDPLIFILWGYVAVTLLFWGRGVFCGWLCPFGALQELANEAARLLRVPQVKVPFGLHERLWPIKHIIFIGLVAVSLHSMAWAVLGTEVEPFKTAISLKFVRHWPFVVYAVGLLLAGLFIERFYCRYLCPLGAALAIPARLRMFEWLKRRFQCGNDCQICASRCTVQAIHPTGEINPNECIYCLACQANYSDDQLCPPLVQRRKRLEKLLRQPPPEKGGAATGGVA